MLFFVFFIQAKSANHPVAFALVMINVGAMPNRTFVTVVMENEVNTTVFDLKVREFLFYSRIKNPRHV